MIQRADVHGQGNVTVQIVGENNRVTIAGAAALRLTMYPRRRREGGEIGLLSPYTQSICLVGRHAEMAKLKGWLGSERDIAIQVRTGRAGTGKTRLAFDLCDELQGGDWQAGFVNGENLKNLVADAGARWGWEVPTLAVVDYAAEWAEPLRRWFGQLADFASPDAPPLRILLLERQAYVDSGWLQTVVGSGTSQERSIREMLDPGEPLVVSELMAPDERRAVLDGMLTKLQSPIRTPAVGTDPDFDRHLDDLTWGGEPLFLMMAALLAAETSLPQVLELPRTEIAHKVAKREIGRLRGLARERGLAPELLVHMAAYVTLCQGLARNALLHAIETEATEFRWRVAPGAGTVADTLADALPGTPAAVEPIRPDALGEAVVLQALGDPRIDSAAVVARAYGQAGASVAAFVIRAAQDFAAAGYNQPLAWLDKLVNGANVEQLVLLMHTLPRSSLVLLEHAARITAKVTDRLLGAVPAGDARWLPMLATALSNLGARLSKVGHRNEALVPTQAAVAIRRALAAKAPNAFRPGLASSLNNLAALLSAVSQGKEALEAVEEAVAIRRELAAKAPDVYRPDLASALHNLGACLSEVGQRQEALESAKEATDLYRELAAKAPDAYRPDLASAVKNLSMRLSEVGQRQKALESAKEAAELYRELAAKAPDAYRPDLASALDNMGNRLSEVGQHQEALGPAKEAADLYHELAAKAPDAYRPDLASTLNNLAVTWGDVGQHQEALKLAQEAVAIRRELATKAPEAYRPALAGALANLATSLGDVGQHEEALEPAQEAADLYRELAAKAPDAYRPDLARSIASLANLWEKTGDLERAIESSREAIEIYAPFFLAQPTAFAHWMVPMCQQYIERCGNVGQEPDTELLRPMVGILQRMQEGSKGEAS